MIEQINNYIFDERFYTKMIDGERIYQPSVTYVLGEAYPMGYGLMQWKGDVGNKRAQEIMEEAGAEGTYVHNAIEELITGHTVETAEINERFKPKSALKIHRCLKAFLDWWAEVKPEIIAHEFAVWDGRGFAGTVDLHCKIGDEEWIVDYKTSNSIQDKHRVQVAAYGAALNVNNRALLHLGNKTKKRWSFLAAQDKHEQQWWDTLKLFQTLNPNAKPSSETFPDEYKLTK